MLQINQFKIKINHSEHELEKQIRKQLRLNDNQKMTYKILKRSIDGRKKPDIFFVYSLCVSVDNEDQILKKNKDNNISRFVHKKYSYPNKGTLPLKNRPIIIGAGPAGLFAALLLTECGYEPIVLERGKKVEDRMKDVQDFWDTGKLILSSNVQFGEGGAGTFSDGKLNTAVKDSKNRNQFVLEQFVKYGAPEDILYDNKPHIGTDILCKVIENIRLDLTEKGCDFYFENQVTDFVIENNKLLKVICQSNTFESDVCVLAPGHSARDTFRTLYSYDVPMECKQFAVGFRVEHPQSMINFSQYGKEYIEELKAANYKVTANFPNGRGVYSFCMCPGGYVVNSSSENGGTVVNGMSYSGRDSQNANSAIIVSVGPKDFGSDDALAGMKFQSKIEKAAFEIGNGKIPQQLFGDYCKNKESHAYGEYSSCTKGNTTFANLRGIFSDDIEETFIEGMHHFSKIIPGFDREDAILSGVESRTSSPVRIQRNDMFESMIEGLYPCGEGAGYAGGIMSAAMDGLKVAEAIIEKYDYIK